MGSRALGYPPSLGPGYDPSYPFGNFNLSSFNYTGPQLPVFYDYYRIWDYLTNLKDACSRLIGPGIDRWTYLVQDCVLENSNEIAKANLASYAYILTLWPAIVSIFASAGPDASDAAYDNLFWGVLLAATSGGQAGFRSPDDIPHHIHTTDSRQAERICQSGEAAYNGPGQKSGRFSPQRQLSSKWFAPSQWVVLVLANLVLGIFLGTYLWALSQSFYYSAAGYTSWAWPGVWLYLAALPAVLEAVARLYANNIDLYEPRETSEDSDSVRGDPEPFAPTETEHAPTTETLSRGNSNPVPPPRTKSGHVVAQAGPTTPINVRTYRRVKCSKGFQTWWRIFRHQMRGRPYRLLVKPHPFSFWPGFWQVSILTSRFCLLVAGFILQATFTLYPPQLVIAQTAMLGCVTNFPRILWPYWWMRDRRGADLVVFCANPLTAEIGGTEISLQ